MIGKESLQKVLLDSLKRLDELEKERIILKMTILATAQELESI